MIIGLKFGAAGANVAKLQRALGSAGHAVEPAETLGQKFGRSTLAALQALQTKHGLSPTKQIDAATHKLLLKPGVIPTSKARRKTAPPLPAEAASTAPTVTPPADATQTTTLLPSPAASTGPASAKDASGVVTGKMVDGDGAPITGAKISLYVRNIRTELLLGEAQSGPQGQYTITYRRPSPLNLEVRSLDSAGKLIATSATVFAAPATVVINLTTAADGVVRAPSQYTILAAQVAGQLQGTPPQNLKEDKDNGEVSFLAKSLGLPFNNVAYLVLAGKIGAANQLLPTTMYGLFRQRIPASLDAALAKLPDAGMDDTMAAQVLEGVLAHNSAFLNQALTGAVTANMLPASYAASQAAELAKLDALRIQSIGQKPYLAGKTPLNDLLAAGAVPEPVKAAFLQAYAANDLASKATWDSLTANKNLAPANLATLRSTLAAGDLLTGNLPLVQDTLQRLGQKTLRDVQDLALLSQSDWVARITKLDPKAASIPPMLATDTPTQRITQLASTLSTRFAQRYPTTAFAGGLANAKRSSFKSHVELGKFLAANPAFDLKQTNIDQFMLANPKGVPTNGIPELKAAQRLFRVLPDYAHVEALHSAGYASAQSIYFKGAAPFTAHMTPTLGNTLAASTFGAAQATYAATLAAYGNFNQLVNGVTFAVAAPPAPDPTALANLPDMQALFGTADYFQCADCRSVYSPAAYLVDLLNFLGQRAADSSTEVLGAPIPPNAPTAQSILLERRPDLVNVALNCNNSDITLPYIDLVNEVMEEAVVGSSATPVGLNATTTVFETLGTSAERRALPQNILLSAYAQTAVKVFPLSLPYDLPFAQVSAYLAALGTSLAAVMKLLNQPAPAVAAANLGINPEMQNVINQADSQDPWKRWGFANANPQSVLDPITRKTYPAPTTPPTTVDWVGAMKYVPVFLHQSGLNLQQLYQLLEVKWVTGSAVTLSLGAPNNVLSADISLMTFTGLTAGVLDNANRFLRLWNATGLRMWELDWALDLSPNSQLDDAFLIFLSDALTVAKLLNLPFQEVLCFWGAMGTRDVTSHLGEQDTAIPAAYAKVFRSPTMLVAWGDVFTPALPTTAIPPPAASDPTVTLDANTVSAIAAALSLSAGDVNAITNSIPLQSSTLTLDTLNAIFRVARLASALSTGVPDLLLWIKLTETNPFSQAPSDTLEFLRRLAVLQGSGLAAHDLDYLLWDNAPEQSALAFTTDQATAVLQTICRTVSGLPLLPPTAPNTQSLPDPDSVQAVFVQTLSTATQVTANVVTPVIGALIKSGNLQFSPLTLAQLLGPVALVDPSATTAIIMAAKAAAIFTALKPTESEFAFLVNNSGQFSWMNVASLPVTPQTNINPYPKFEALLFALKLNQRQSARGAKLFDYYGPWLIAHLPSVTWSAAAGPAVNNPGLGFALNGSDGDFASIAEVLYPPQTTMISSMADLHMIAQALDFVARYGVSGDTLVQLAVHNTVTTDPADITTAAWVSAAKGALQAQYSQSAWFGAIQPVEDALRQTRRDALVACLLGPGITSTAASPMLTTDDLFDYYLIDPEMSSCALTTRLLQASLAIQQFVQQCFLNLVTGVKIDATADPAWNEWSWMKQFRLWQANRQVFLYPENYLLPELRTGKSPFFTDLENDLRQSNCDDDAVIAAFENYLRKLVEVSRLVISAHYHETKPDGTRVLHVFAHTRGTPPKWYYRTRADGTLGSGIWSAWEPLNLDIPDGQLIPVMWDQRLHLIWPVFKQKSEKAADQPIPQTGGNTQTSASPPVKFWVVEFALSELSAGQWQAKRTIAEKMYFQLEDPPTGFTFRAFQDSNSNLQIEVYASVIAEGNIPTNIPVTDAGMVEAASSKATITVPVQLIAVGQLPTPEAPLSVVEATFSLPPSNMIDLANDPTYAKILAVTSLTAQLGSPTNYKFYGQDLTYKGYPLTISPTTPTSLVVLCSDSSSAQPVNVKLLNSIVNPRMIIPLQEQVFDSADPFFVEDQSRIFFIQTLNYTGPSSAPTFIANVPYDTIWATEYFFRLFYHPFARTFLRELEIGGSSQLMRRSLQLSPESVSGRTPLDFIADYKPGPAVDTIQPVTEDVDFSVDGAYSLYNWELFYHAPMFVSSLLMQNQQYASAMKWLEYIFNPTDGSSMDSPQRYWQTKPFNQMNAADWLNQQIQNLLTALATDNAQGITNDGTAVAIQDWMANPFDPHRVARLRIGAYGKATVMKFLDNLLAWGDSLYSLYTMENVSQAEQLYVFADLILGPAPVAVRLRESDQPAGADTLTYAAIKNLTNFDAFSNALVAVENVVVAPAVSAIPATAATLPQLVTGTAQSLFFCIPPNEQMLAYWDKVAQRLYNIRHCLNLQGVAQPLPLYGPPLNPLDLAAGLAGGNGGAGASSFAFTPIYRFATYLQRAVEMTNDVRSYGGLILSALEKKDAELMALLRANQDLDIQTKMLDVRTIQVKEAQDQITVLQNQQKVAQIRHDYYSTIAYMNEWEITAMALQGTALILNGTAVVLDLTAGGSALVPTFTGGASGFGGSPVVTVTEGGQNIADSVKSFANVARSLAGILSESGGLASTMGGYQRRKDDWDLQAKLAAAEIDQISSQITAAQDRLDIANAELTIHNQQIANAQAVSDFLTSKYTNAQLYDWMLTQLTSIYTQAYQLAFNLAQQAQAVYQFELGNSTTFLQTGYWDSQHRGLMAGESLLFDLRRMESQYLADNARELELTKHISLALIDPLSLVQLINTGTCQISLNESLFDQDHPGHFYRRLRSVALTIPCVTGPYTGVNATLTLQKAAFRSTALASTDPYVAMMAVDAPMAPLSGTNAVSTIVTSSGQNDSGLFETNLHDERWLPFEGQGAISTFSLKLNAADNNFDLSTITDVILHIRYTARLGDETSASTIRLALATAAMSATTSNRSILVSVRNTFGDAYYKFFNPTDQAAQQQTLVLPLTKALFPYSNLGNPKISDINVLLVLAQPQSTGPNPSNPILATFGPTGGANLSSPSFTPLTIPNPAGPAGPVLGMDVSLTAADPGSYTVTVPLTGQSSTLFVTNNGITRLDSAQIEDIVLIISYSIS